MKGHVAHTLPFMGGIVYTYLPHAIQVKRSFLPALPSRGHLPELLP